MRQFDPFVVIVLLIIAVAAPLARRFHLRTMLPRGSKNTMPDSPDTSAILSYYTRDQDLANLSRGTLNGMAYSLILATPADPSVDDSSAIYTLDLPYSTETHVIGLSKQHKIDRVAFEQFLLSQNMERVDLEGDFNDYFDIYAAPDQQVNARVVLNPKSMAFVVDYCRSHFWEINTAEMYFVVTNASKKGDDLITESQQFVEQIRPALTPGMAGAPEVHHEVPYGEYDGPIPKCPICPVVMTQQQGAFICPAGHGTMVSGSDLHKMHDGDLKLTLPTVTPVSHEMLACPHCGNEMVEDNYEETGIMINSCSSCPYRWLDADKVAKIESQRAPSLQ